MRGTAILFIALALAGCGQQPSAPVPANASASVATPEPALPPDKTVDTRCATPVEFHRAAAGMIPNAAVAKQVGLAYMRGAYADLPEVPGQTLDAELRNGIWYVGLNPPAGWLGGGPNVEICRSNGLVLKIYATQ